LALDAFEMFLAAALVGLFFLSINKKPQT